LIRKAGRVPAERDTTYGRRLVFDGEEVELGPLDRIGDDGERRFGSFEKMIKMNDYRYRYQPKSRDGKPS
jgi:hypothetical protein